MDVSRQLPYKHVLDLEQSSCLVQTAHEELVTENLMNGANRDSWKERHVEAQLFSTVWPVHMCMHTIPEGCNLSLQAV